MDVYFLAYHNLPELLNHFREFGELHAPVQGEDGGVRYAHLPLGSLPNLSATRTLLPPKKYLLHQHETIFTYTNCDGYKQTSEEPTPKILFALHPCDLAGINYLDQLFLGNQPDSLYETRRSSITLIGISCTPDEFCSCHLTPSPLHAFSDIFLQAVDDGFAVTSSSKRGYEILKTAGNILKKHTHLIPDNTRHFFDQQISRHNLAEIDVNLPDWDELGLKCLGCGGCSISCPTCSCFDLLEFGGLNASYAERVRIWDNCLFKSHSQIAGGKNFIKNRGERFRYRYRHKYRGFGATKEIPSCVGCGRCRVTCPVAIDLRPLATKIEGGENE